MRPTRHTSDSRLFFDWLEIAARDLLAARLLMEQGQCLDIAASNAWKKPLKPICSIKPACCPTATT